MNDIKITAKTEEIYELGAWMGRKQAFASLAGRCSAADAECLRQIREQKRYRALNMNWEQFCKQRVGVSYNTVDKIIRRLEEFGPAYFLLVQATGITDNEYRRISSAVKEKKLLHAGEEIPIIAENAPKLAAAVEALRRELPDPRDETNLSSGALAKGKDPESGSGSTRAVVLELQRARCEMRSALQRYRGLARRNQTSQLCERIGGELSDFSLELKKLSQRFRHE